MKFCLSLVLFICIATVSFGQTKRIAHKSHGGNISQFSPQTYTDNMGLIPEITLRLDSVIKISEQAFVHVTFAKYANSKTPITGRDTITSHPFLNGQISFEQFKQTFNPHTTFIGFDEINSTEIDQENGMHSFAFPWQPNSPFSPLTLFLGLFVLLIGSGFIWFQLQQKQNL